VVSVVLYGCGQSTPAPQESEKEGGVKPKTGEPSGGGQQETTQQAAGNIPLDGVIGESIETPQFDYRVLDVYATDHYYYLDDPSIDFVVDTFSQAGKFVVVNYSATNTSPETVKANLGARLFVEAGSKVEVYEETDSATHPRSGAIMGGPELGPRELLLGQFIFDVPADVEPETLAVLYEDDIEEARGEAGNVDLTEEDPQGPRPEEILSLQYEYNNMTVYEQSYELFAQETKDRVSEQMYVSGQKEYDVAAFMEYSFPSVDVQADRATVERVATYANKEETGQDKATQELVLEDDGWRVVMRDEQYELFAGNG